ncbi:hypothetical protein Ancab_040278 [Ancistrocladus abbreviatus]
MVAGKIKEIREKVDRIRNGVARFALTVPYYETFERRGREETDSFTDVEVVIGRDVEKNDILSLLLSRNADEKNVPVISIVGVAGQGKTTLARLAYNDMSVKIHFDLRLWLCISDVFDIREIIVNILSLAAMRNPEHLPMDLLEGELGIAMSRRRYLLVLDDVRIEDLTTCRRLRDLLMGGRTGSKILVTTRSMDVAKAMGCEEDISLYVLGGLSKDDSWSLFAKMAFGPGQEDRNPDLVKLGKEIVKKCANVPLTIRTIGSLLRGKGQREWLYLKETVLANITENENITTDALKLSYDHLPSESKHCLAYCALWPKDSEMVKEQVIRMWIAQGFIASEYQSPEEIGEMISMDLLRKRFFRDATIDESGNIISFEMNDLKYYQAREVASGDMVAANSNARNLNERIPHLLLVEPLTSSSKLFKSLLKLASLRTLLLRDKRKINESLLNELFSSLRCLRVLDLSGLGKIELLPSSISKLIHLRYLDLSRLSIKALPNSILKLQNLQTLNLSGCSKLTRLPWGIKKLINLRHLDLRSCSSLKQIPVGITVLSELRSLNLRYCDSMRHMPSGMGNLIAIQTLDCFIVGTDISSGSHLRVASAQLGDLKTLNNLRGRMEICMHGKLEEPVSDRAKGADLSKKHGLSELKLKWETEEDDNRKADPEGVLEGLQPHFNLKQLEIENYGGERLPSWASTDQLTRALPNLVKIKLTSCRRWECLPLFGQLPSLKHLSLCGLRSVRYMESFTSTTEFFPSLEIFELYDMERLEGWWSVAGEGGEPINGSEASTSSMGAAGAIVATEQLQQHQPPSFPKLAKLEIFGCPNLTSMPLIPCVEKLKLVGVKGNPIQAAFAFGSGTCSASKLKMLEIDSAEHLTAIPNGCLQNLSVLQIRGRLYDSEFVIDWSSMGREFARVALSSLPELLIRNCRNLPSLSGIGLEHLTALQTLKILDCRELELSEGDGLMPWTALKSLRQLEIGRLPKIRALPRGLQYLTALQSLTIDGCHSLKSLGSEWISSLKSLEILVLKYCYGLEHLPEGISLLTNLKSLRIGRCSGTLTERCTENGEDRPLICHIPSVIIL